MNIYEKLAAITAELNSVAKNLMVGEGRNSYKAVGEADVLAAVKPLEMKYKVYSYPYSRSVIDSDIFTTKKIYNGQESEISKLFMRLETVYRFVDTENPSDFVDITTYGDGVDSNDKAPGKAMTYGDKYALLKAYKIITGDDPDKDASQDEKLYRNRQTAQQDKPGARIPLSGDRPVICEKCNKFLPDYWDGTRLIKAAELAERSIQKNGKVLCFKCDREVNK